jgi:protein involved in polysaccharide export with SLBB domain
MSAHAPSYATRAQLETMAAQCTSDAMDPKRSDAERAQASEDARALRERLASGDFRVGDRVVVRVSGGASSFDTLTVSTARSIKVLDAGEVSLDGVLRSELDGRLNTELARYFRDVVVRAQPLTRLAVIGEVRNPGFVQVPSQALLSDAISAAGGPTTAGRLDRVSVRRGGASYITPGAFAKGLAAGSTLDALGIRAGDEIVVSAKRPFNWTQALQTTAVVVGSAATIIAIQRR